MHTKIKGALRQTHYQAAQNADDAAELIKTLGEKRREIVRIETEMNDEIANIKQRYEDQAMPQKGQVAEIIAAVQAWAETHRAELTHDGKIKTVKLATGEFNWRVRPPRVSLRGKGKIITALKGLGLTRFIRVSEDIDKEAILKEKAVASQIQGVTISSAGEDFAISPYELEIEDKQ